MIIIIHFLEQCPTEERMMETMIPPQVGMKLWTIKEKGKGKKKRKIKEKKKINKKKYK